jgi:hypothetical protein
MRLYADSSEREIDRRHDAMLDQYQTTTAMAHLTKPPVYNVAETNIALWGSDVRL